jgi:putative ABC transport system substrate-binding protein
MNLVGAFRQGLIEAGYVEGQNVSIEYSWAEGQYDRLPALASDLVRRRVDIIVTPGSTPAAVAAKKATTTIPIVFITASDPVKLGLVASLDQPGSNATGVAYFIGELSAKRLELLHDVVPEATVIAILVNPNSPATETQVMDMQAAALTARQQIIVLKASTEREIDTAFATLIEEGARALLVASDAFFFSSRDQLVALAAQHAVPAIYTLREYAAGSGLMSYAIDLADGYRQAGIYAGKLLKGAKPADLPVIRSTKFELVINLKTAKTLGLEIPSKLLALADEVIE